MTTPNKSEIEARATELYHNANPHILTNPEESELKESGFLWSAQCELMGTPYKEFEAQKQQPDRKVMQQKEALSKTVNDLLAYGDCLLIANKGCGKTNALMQLARQLRQLENTRVIVFETFPLWMNEYDTIPYLYINDLDVLETQSAIELNQDDYFVRTSRDYTILRGSEIQQALDNNKDLLFTIAIEDTDRLSFFISSVVYDFYRKHYLTAYKYGLKAINERVIFVCEEAQNLFDSSIISKRIFNKLRKMFSETRNLKLHFLMASQRIQDLNTKIRGRTQYLIGKVNLDDYDLKVKRILSSSQHREDILTLELGTFLDCNSDSLIQFEKFEQLGKPYEYIMQKPQKPKRPFLERLLSPFIKQRN